MNTEKYIEILFKRFGKDDTQNIYTPYPLVKEMLSKLPSIEGKVLVLYNIEFAFTLWKDYNINPSNIWVYTNCEKKANVLRKLAFNVVFSYITLDGFEEIKNMKFDVVLGNPPYQSAEKHSTQSLWPKFTKLAFDLLLPQGTVCLVTPNKWAGFVNSLPNKSNIFRDYFKPHTSYINMGECSKYFPGIGNSDNYFSYFIVTTNNKSTTTLMTQDGSFILDKNLDFLPINYFNNPLNTTSIISKTMVGDFTKFDFSSKDYYKRTNDNQIVVNCGQRQHISKLDIFLDDNINNSNPNTKVRITKSSHDTTNEIVNSLFKSKLFLFLHGVYWNFDTYTPLFYQNLPNPGLSKIWSDQDLYEYFNLTQDEINLIESTIK